METVRAGRKDDSEQPSFRVSASARTNKEGCVFGGFIAVRRGLLEHLRRGKLTESEALTFIIMLGLANPYTGIWWGSAKSLWGEYPFYGSERRARRALEGLASKWYIKRLSTPGKHSNYPILIDKYEVKVGDKVGLRLNAHKSNNENSLCYEPAGWLQGFGELGVIAPGEQVVKVGVFEGGGTSPKEASSPPLLKNKKENEKKKEKTIAQPLASFVAFEAFWKLYPKKVGKPAAQKAWAAIWKNVKQLSVEEFSSKHGTFIEKIFAGLERWKQTEQWQNPQFVPYPATFLNRRQWEDTPPKQENLSEQLQAHLARNRESSD